MHPTKSQTPLWILRKLQLTKPKTRAPTGYKTPTSQTLQRLRLY